MAKIFLWKAVFLSAALLVAMLVGAIYSVPEMAIPSDKISRKNGESAYQKNTNGEEINLPNVDLMLGQSFVVGIYGTELDDETEKFLRQLKPAGIILYSRNCQNREQLKNFIAQLQDVGKETTGRYYFIMIDEEPGGASRLALFNNVFEFGAPDWDRIEGDIKTMEDIGINVNLAPLADFPFNEDTFIKKRIQAHTPEALTDFNKKFIVLSNKNHVFTTLKHFPGMGVFIDDPHQKLPHVESSWQVIDDSLKIFKSGIDAGAAFVMTGHGVYDDMDCDVPATISKKIATDILRNDLNFNGLVITDDLSDMPFISGKNINLTDATAASLKAGHNLVMFSHGKQQASNVYEKLLERLSADQELKATVEQNYRTVVSLKDAYF